MLVVCSAICLFTSLVCSQHAVAQQQGNLQPSASPLVRVLQAKGILTAEEVAQLNQASSTSDADQRLAKLLLSKGVISQTDYNQMLGSPGFVTASNTSGAGPQVVPAIYHLPGNAPAGSASTTAAPLPNVSPIVASSSPNDAPNSDAQQPTSQTASVAQSTLSAVTPIRPLPVGGIKKGELSAAIKLAGIGITPYGFLKATFINDSSSPGGDDFPLPGFLGDTGPTAAPEFHVKARSTRLGTNFEWLDSSSNLTVTGKFEMDFEGNFNRSDNRNLSSIRSYNPSIRLAYGRLDYRINDKDTFSTVIGQDWTPFTSSTLPNMLETTGLGIAFGDLYERAPQFRFGYTHDFGKFQFLVDTAVVLPAIGLTPSAANLSNQLGYGERQGPDNNSPQMEGRIVGQWQLDHAPGVSPAQIIFSWEEGHRRAIVLGSTITSSATIPAIYKTTFARGVNVSSPTVGWDAEWQLPTRWLTFVGKYYNGSDLRYYFGGQLFSNYNQPFGLTNTVSVLSIDGASTVVLGTNANGVAVVAPQLPVRAQGGFGQLGFPISRWFHANPDGREAGWSAYAMYGQDVANQTDVTHAAGTGSRQKGSMLVGTINYKLNKWLSFSFEESLYRTWANTQASGYPLFEGVPQALWKDIRSEGGAIFSF